MYILLLFISLVEAATGLALFIDPFVVTKLLFGSQVSGIGVVVSRIAGASLIALGIACLPSRLFGSEFTKGQAAMLIYNLIASLYLAFWAMSSEFVGPWLWPVIFFHAIMTLLLFRGVFARSA